jgi:hypothetical protein
MNWLGDVVIGAVLWFAAGGVTLVLYYLAKVTYQRHHARQVARLRDGMPDSEWLAIEDVLTDDARRWKAASHPHDKREQ